MPEVFGSNKIFHYTQFPVHEINNKQTHNECIAPSYGKDTLDRYDSLNVIMNYTFVCTFCQYIWAFFGT